MSNFEAALANLLSIHSFLMLIRKSFVFFSPIAVAVLLFFFLAFFVVQSAKWNIKKINKTKHTHWRCTRTQRQTPFVTTQTINQVLVCVRELAWCFSYVSSTRD